MRSIALCFVLFATLSLAQQTRVVGFNGDFSNPRSAALTIAGTQITTIDYKGLVETVRKFMTAN